jgi:hypothetical protein
MGIEIQPIDGHAFAREVIGVQLWRDFEPADLDRIRVPGPRLGSSYSGVKRSPSRN